MATIWHIDLFGGLQARCADLTVTHFGTRKTAALLAYLALHSTQAQSREVLAELLWPDEDGDATRDRFRQALSTLRRILEPTQTGKVLLADRTGVRLAAAAFTSDVAEFEAELKAAGNTSGTSDTSGAPNASASPVSSSPDDSLEERADRLDRALSLYRGELLPGFYEDWIAAERERLAERYQEALRLLSAIREAQGDLEAALEIARRLLTAAPMREDTHTDLMRLYAKLGRQPDVVRQYRELERMLREQWDSSPSAATQTLYAQLRSGVTTAASSTLAAVSTTPVSWIALEAEGGAVPLDSQFYLLRPVDGEFQTALARHDSIVLVKGARQTGKTSLLARGLQQTRQSGAKVVMTDLQKFTDAQMVTADALFFSLAEMLAEQLELDTDVEALWSAPRGWNVKFERFLRREALAKSETPIVWGLDETDRLFAHPFRMEVFGLFRSWHNERSLNPEGPWSRLTLAIAYATEAHLFITDLNQSPFNVGTRLALDDFTLLEVGEINRRYGSPLKDASELARYYALVGGNPYLVRRGLHFMTTNGLDEAAFEAEAARENGLFGDALRRMASSLSADSRLRDIVRGLLQGELLPDPDSFYRLRSAGIVLGDSEANAQIRCRLYGDYLRRHLP